VPVELETLTDKSVIVQPSDSGVLGSGYVDIPFLWLGAAYAGAHVPEWGVAPAARDRYLRQFYKTENVLAAAIAIVASRNAAMEWKLTGPKNAVTTCHNMLSNANMTKGMTNFVWQLSVDLYTQDKGAFVEIVKRNPDDPNSGTIGLNILDPESCMLTGNALHPVIYQDLAGKYHKLPWYRVYHATEMETSDQKKRGLQVSAVSRVLAYADKHKSLTQYETEKISGQHTKAIHVIQGVNKAEVEAALKASKFQAEASGQIRYSQPAVMAAINPEAKIDHKMIELAMLPESWDKSEDFKEYLTVIAMALLTDYLELAPLPGGNLGSASQSEQLDKKSRAKGAENFRKLLSHMMNHAGILPQSVEFAWIDNDADAEQNQATQTKTRAEARKAMIDNGEITVPSALKMALDAEDIDQDIYDFELARWEKEQKEKEKREQEASARAEAAAAQQATADPETTETQDGQPGASPNATNNQIDPGQGTQAQNATKSRGYRPKVWPARLRA